MTSWFQSTTGLDLNSAFDTLTETVQNVTESVQDAIPTEHKEFLAKITLNTEEMISEREDFREEALRKEEAKNRLNKILPWETLDPEREILVEECKEVILELSSREDTFFGPYKMPLLKVVLEEAEDEETNEEPENGSDTIDGDDDEASPVEDEEQTRSKGHRRHMEPSEESLEMLAKLEPLPSLLEDFDLDTHVGLIQRVMAEDPKLVNMQANLSGGGAREKTFWHNFFFHCAFARYEAGLSLDEIWSYGEDSSNAASHIENSVTTDVSDAAAASLAIAANNEEDVGAGSENASAENSTSVVDTTVDSNAEFAGTTDTSLTELSELSPKNGFELVDDDISGDTDVAGDPELDELEAEIARELGDL